jgi:hypothetical protein
MSAVLVTLNLLAIVSENVFSGPLSFAFSEYGRFATGNVTAEYCPESE